MARKSKSETWEAFKANAESVETLCERIIAGESLTQIAQSLGASVSSLTAWIAADDERSARARGARVASARTYDDMALDEIRAASDPFALAKAREVASHLRWRASKIAPTDYGDKIEHEHKGGVTLVMQPVDERL